ncbi:MAG: CDGSH iron-sulfur domain-containing protein [Leptonema sp. (in: bacteria)]
MDFEPKIVQKAPFVIEEEAGTKRAWCSCGLSQTQPYCDGSHKKENTGMSPVVVNIEKKQKIAWCGCKHSQNKPYCDGTHKKL